MKVGYVRVSTQGQNTARQEVLMQELGVEKVFLDKQSGKDTARPELKKMMEFVREGDVVIVESISRFARCTRDLLELVEQLSGKGVAFVSKKESLDTSTPSGRFVLTIFGAIAIAKAQGKYTGRPPKTYPDLGAVLEAWRRGEISVGQARKQLGVSKSTFYRLAANQKKEANKSHE